MRISDWSSDVCSSDLAALQQSRKGPENDAGEIADAVFRAGVIFRRMPERLVLLCQKILPFTQTLEPYDSSGNSFRPQKIGRAHVGTPVTNAHIVCRPLPEQKQKTTEKKQET